MATRASSIYGAGFQPVEIFAPIRDPEHFKTVRVESHGHSVYWGEEGNEQVDFGCDRLREIAEEQAASVARAG